MQWQQRVSSLAVSVILYHMSDTINVLNASTGVTKAVVCTILSVGWCI